MKTYITKLFFGICVALFLSACSSTSEGWNNFLSMFDKSQPVDPNSLESLAHVSGTKLLLINTPAIKFYDLAVIRFSYYAIHVDLFQMGTPIGALEISKNEVCFQGECAPKSLAARKIFGEVSYGDLFDDIFFSADIFGGKGLRITKEGVLTQRFLLNNQEILYERTNEYTLFKNLTKGIVISIQNYSFPNMNPPNPRQR
ncbi:hypothetical protein [Helicobacter brantae]|uniref:Lipoprotein n=1 Tax=Helicobacter brantae TaxID=375927 RepID=A0A3D8IYM0_9HELI|nr:hypothetical protein [Helicobacter brantae]RDU70367.1 hypothetical protein CQA58_05910 [Helicobacter brantae]